MILAVISEMMVLFIFIHKLLSDMMKHININTQLLLSTYDTHTASSWMDDYQKLKQCSHTPYINSSSIITKNTDKRPKLLMFGYNI